MHVLLKPLGENWPFGQKIGFVKKRLEIEVICLHIIILYAIDIHKIRCLAIYGHFHIRRSLAQLAERLSYYHMLGYQRWWWWFWWWWWWWPPWPPSDGWPQARRPRARLLQVWSAKPQTDGKSCRKMVVFVMNRMNICRTNMEVIATNIMKKNLIKIFVLRIEVHNTPVCFYLLHLIIAATWLG